MGSRARGIFPDYPGLLAEVRGWLQDEAGTPLQRLAFYSAAEGEEEVPGPSAAGKAKKGTAPKRATNAQLQDQIELLTALLPKLSDQVAGLAARQATLEERIAANPEAPSGSLPGGPAEDNARHGAGSDGLSGSPAALQGTPASASTCCRPARASGSGRSWPRGGRGTDATAGCLANDGRYVGAEPGPLPAGEPPGQRRWPVRCIGSGSHSGARAGCAWRCKKRAAAAGACIAERDLPSPGCSAGLPKAVPDSARAAEPGRGPLSTAKPLHDLRRAYRRVWVASRHRTGYVDHGEPLERPACGGRESCIRPGSGMHGGARAIRARCRCSRTLRRRFLLVGPPLRMRG